MIRDPNDPNRYAYPGEHWWITLEPRCVAVSHQVRGMTIREDHDGTESSVARALNRAAARVPLDFEPEAER